MKITAKLAAAFAAALVAAPVAHAPAHVADGPGLCVEGNHTDCQQAGVPERLLSWDRSASR